MAEQENWSAEAVVGTVVGVKAQVVVAGAKGEEAVRFYKAAFGAEEVRRETHPKRKAKQELPLLHFAELRIGAASSFLVSYRIDDDDSVPAAGGNEVSGAGIVMRLEAEDLDGAVARAVAAGAKLQGAIAEGEAKLLDSFGVAWILTSSAPKNPTSTAASASASAAAAAAADRTMEAMASPEEHRISIPDNATGSAKRAGTEVDQKVSCTSNQMNVDEEKWISEVKDKIERLYWPWLSDDEIETKICKFKLLEEKSQSRWETVEGFSQPKVVTIGPFHRRNKMSISDDKKRMIVILMGGLYVHDLAGCIRKMKNQAEKARKSYSTLDINRSGFKDETFAEMLLLDSYFILFVLTIKIRKRTSGYTLMPIACDSPMRPLARNNTTKVLDIIFNKDEIAPDLLILDNQIPFFVIEELLTELKLKKSLHEYALEFFKTIHPRSTKGCERKKRPEKFLHLLHHFHWSRVPENKYKLSPPPQQPDSMDWAARHCPNAMELRESATMFEKKKSGSSLEFTFRRRLIKRIIWVLDIPELHIRNYSGLIFHNLITFEMQNSSHGRCTMSFSVFMRNMLQSEEDVKLLRQRGILESSSLANNKLVDLFEYLSKLTENHQMPSELCDICQKLVSYHKNRMSRVCGFIILGYFPSPLVSLSVAAAAIIFAGTVLQTVYTILGYYYRR